MQSKKEFAGHLFAMNSILRPTRPSTSAASPRVVDRNLQRPLEHDLCISLQIGDILKDICLQTDERPWTNHGSHMPFTNMQLSQRCSVAALFPVCLCLLIFCFHIPGMLGLFGKVPVTLSLESQIPSIVQQATWDKNQNRKIRWSLFGCRGCSCLDFQRIRIYFDQFWG